MFKITDPDYVKCSFGSGYETSSNLYKGKLDVFFAETRDLRSRYPELKNFISCDEQIRADKFRFDKNRETYLACHALLRLVLAQCLNVSPLEISYQNGINNKPGLVGDPIYFNVTHTKEAFAFAISRDFYVGIDLEDVNQFIDIHNIIESFFSKKEREYILNQQTETKNRFFLLWTRKEALLKALGTGIINNLTQIEVSEQENFINKKSFDNLVSDSAFNEHFIYSKKLWNYYLSIATPHKATINFYHMNKENIVSYLD